MYRSSRKHEELSRTDSDLERSEFWKIVDRTKPENLRAFSDEEIRDCQNFFFETLDSTLPAYESVTASLRLILLRGEIDLRRSDARQRQTQRLARWAIRGGILSAVVILSAVAAIVFGIANRPTPERVPVAATEATEIPAIIPPTPAALPTTTPTPATSATTTPAGGPWLFPDSSSRYLSATDVSSLSSADLWRARNEIFARKGYKFSTPRGIVFAQTLGNYYRGVDDDQGHVFNKMNQYERANVTLIRAIERGR
jgi:hypothetical protein